MGLWDNLGYYGIIQYPNPMHYTAEHLVKVSMLFKNIVGLLLK